MRKNLTLTLTAAACLLLIGCSSSNESKKAEEKQAPPAAAPATTPEAPKVAEAPAPTPPLPELKKPEVKPPAPKAPAAKTLPESAPENFNVHMDTSKGMVVMECHKSWSPRGADHFYDLVKLHFYDDSRFFRVIRSPRPFMAQFGINGTPATNSVWANASFPDDPPAGKHNTRGMVTYGQTSAKNSRSTQLFINFTDNSFLDSQGFTPVCSVTSGMDAVDQFYSGYGDAPNQGLIGSQGNAYLNSQFPRLDYIKKATIVLQ
jgi:peptidyl-prolyl cis-trans isomerase A (cyclophilin A)